MGIHKLVVLEDGLLVSMARNETFTKEFPFLKSMAGQSNRQSCCSRKLAGNSGGLVKAKQTLAGLDSAKRRRLKELLNAAELRVCYVDPGTRKLVTLTF